MLRMLDSRSTRFRVWARICSGLFYLLRSSANEDRLCFFAFARFNVMYEIARTFAALADNIDCQGCWICLKSEDDREGTWVKSNSHHTLDKWAVLRFKLLKFISCIIFQRKVVKFQASLQWSMKIMCLLIWYFVEILWKVTKHSQKSFVIHAQ